MAGRRYPALEDDAREVLRALKFLEMQIASRDEVEQGLQRHTELYDFAPMV